MIDDDLVKAGVGLCEAMLHHGYIAEELATLFVVLIPKPTGGTRPIGLFPSLLRVLGRWGRRKFSLPWELANPRSYSFGEAGRSCETAVWIQEASAELATMQGKAVASSLLDLKKAYEYVSHRRLWGKAKKHRFHLRFLRYTLATYAMQRAVLFAGMATAPVKASRTIVAGCSQATTLLRMVLICTLDCLQENWPTLGITLVVDDITLQAKGQANNVAVTIGLATKRAVKMLTEQDWLSVQEEKGVCITNSRDMETLLGRQAGLSKVSRLGTRNLGVDAFSGRRGSAKVRKGRLLKAKRRLPRFRRLRMAGARTDRVVKTGLVPAIMYGVSVTGMPNEDLRQARVCCRAALQLGTAGRSLTLDLQLAGKGVDPAEHANRQPIVALARALWDRWLPRSEILRGLVGALGTVEKAGPGKEWTKVCGPFTAVAATLKRIGWKVSSSEPLKWNTHRGQVLLEEIGPKVLGNMVDEATKACLWIEEKTKDLSLCHVSPVPLLAPIVSLLRENSCLDAAQAGALRAAVAHGLWPAARKHRHGLCDSSKCELCDEADAGEWHSLFGCPASEGFREQYGFPSLMRLAKRKPEDPLFTRALLGDPSWEQVPPCLVDDIHWLVGPRAGGGELDSIGYGDGSAKENWSLVLVRCGWGLCTLNAQGLVCDRLYGPLPGGDQRVPVAEAWAFLIYLRLAVLGRLPLSLTASTSGIPSTAGPGRAPGVVTLPPWSGA